MKPGRKAVAMLIVFPITLIGYVIGFVYSALTIGFAGGEKTIDNIADEVTEESKKP